MKTSKRNGLFIAAGIALVGLVLAIVLPGGNSGSSENHASEFAHYYYEADYEELPRVTLNDYSRKGRLLMSELLESFHVVALDSENDKGIVGMYAAPTLSESYIGIKSSEPNKPFCIYDRASGKFIRSFGNVGRGPGEYTGLYDWVIDEPHDRVYLVPFARSTILEYDLSGKYIGTITVPGLNSQRKMKIEVRDSVITSYILPFMEDSIVVRTFTKTGRQLSVARNPFGGARTFDNELYVNKNSSASGYKASNIPIYYCYQHAAGALVPAFGIETSENNEWWSEVYESPAWQLVKIFHLSDKKSRPKDYWLIKDRRSGEKFSGDLVNDYLGGIETTNSSYPDPYYFDHSFAFENGYYMELIPAVTLKRLLEEALEENEMTPEVRERVEILNASFTDEDNHFLFYGKLK
jgi:hypothetical protein